MTLADIEASRAGLGVIGGLTMLARRLARLGAPSRHFHIVSEFSCATGGTELRAVNLSALLSKHVPVSLWSIDTPPSELATWAIQKINTQRLKIPRGGTLILVGAYFYLGRWLDLAGPERVVMIYNTPDPDRLAHNVARVRAATGVEPEVRYTSISLMNSVPYPGIVEPSLFDLEPLERIERSARIPFTVGRLSRDQEIKFHDDDVALFTALADKGFAVRIMGPSPRVEVALRGCPNITLLPCGAERVPEFLASLDAFVYRTHSSWDEPWGRVVSEAMASGLPIVCEPRGGYVEIVEDGVNGLFFSDNAGALASLQRLRADEPLTLSMGKAARRAARRTLSDQARSDVLKSYIG